MEMRFLPYQRHRQQSRIDILEGLVLTSVHETLKSTLVVSDQKYGTPIHVIIEVSDRASNYYGGLKDYPRYAVAHQAFGDRQLGKLQPTYMNF